MVVYLKTIMSSNQTMYTCNWASNGQHNRSYGQDFGTSNITQYINSCTGYSNNIRNNGAIGNRNGHTGRINEFPVYNNKGQIVCHVPY